MTFEIATEKSHCPKKDWLKNITVSKQMIILLLPLCWGGGDSSQNNACVYRIT